MGLFFFMSNVRNILNNIIRLDETDILVSVLKEQRVEDFIVFLNTEKQLRLGLDSEGKLITPDYAPTYGAFKERFPGRQAPPGTPDLRLTGAFYKSFVVQVLDSGDFIIDSNPLKDGFNLMDKYGTDLEGLTKENLEILTDFIALLYVEETKKRIFQ